MRLSSALLATLAIAGCADEHHHGKTPSSLSNAENVARVCFPVDVPRGGVASASLFQDHNGTDNWLVICRDGTVHVTKKSNETR